MSKKQSVQVDDADVDEFITSHLGDLNPALTAEERADLAFESALGFATLRNHSPEWAKELARKVRQRMLWK